ncbi:MAG: PTS sugar transporter subunit IIB [Myxococcota bacterium]|jgi:PTS system mannose-specific IIB component|nr:PTS sugar transporter subunit IIB [Myxococcota bacterium]
MPERVHVRVDNRLLHGQVVQFWIPYLEVAHLIIADDEVAANPALPAIYRMAVPEFVELAVIPVDRLPALLDTKIGANVSTMVLLSDVRHAARAALQGARFFHLTLGNVHASPERSRVTDSVFLSQLELDTLRMLKQRGIVVEIQTFPGDARLLEVDAEGECRWTRP